MNKSNFVQTEGYPLKAERLQEMQTAYSIFNAFGNLAGNLSIISGCQTVGTTVADGVVFINGELLEFRNASGGINSNVVIIEEKTQRAFKSGAVKTVYTTRYATFGTAAVSWPWNMFVRPAELKNIPHDLIDVLIDTNTRLEAIEEKLATIEEGAQKNVQADMNVTNTTSDAFVKNKPLNDILFKSSLLIGNIAPPQGNASMKVDVGFAKLPTANYTVLGTIVSNSGWDNDSGVFFTIANKTDTGFTVVFKEVDARNQNVKFDFVLIRN